MPPPDDPPGVGIPPPDIPPPDEDKPEDKPEDKKPEEEKLPGRSVDELESGGWVVFLAKSIGAFIENTETYATGIPNPVATAWQGGEAAAAVFIAASTAGLLTFTVEAGAGPFTGFAHIWAYE